MTRRYVCGQACPGGLPCCLTSTRHTLHICASADCRYHALERYLTDAGEETERNSCNDRSDDPPHLPDHHRGGRDRRQSQ